MATHDCLERLDPSCFALTIIQGWSSAQINAVARRWVTTHRPGARMCAVEGHAAVRTCVQYTVIDLSAASTPSERSAAMAYMREGAMLQHASTRFHMFLVYDMHLVNSRSFQNLRYARVVGTTTRPGAISEAVMSAAFRVRVRCPLVVPHKLAKLAEEAVLGDCVAAARKYSHEALKTCLDPHMAYLALLEARPGCSDIAKIAEVEHLSHLITRPAHALELAALIVCSTMA